MAVVLIQRRQRLSRWQMGQCAANAFQRLHMALERAGIHRVKTQVAFLPVAAELLRLLRAQGAQLVIVFGPK